MNDKHDTAHPNPDELTALAAADPAASFDADAVRAERSALLADIVSTPRPVPTGTPRRRWLTTAAPVAVAAAVAAIVAGGVAVLGGNDGPPGERVIDPAGSAAEPNEPNELNEPGKPAADNGQTRAGAENNQPADPGLPPTSDNLSQVAPPAGWVLDGLSQDRTGTEMKFTNPDVAGQSITVVTYPAEDYPTYEADRESIGPEHSLTALGQTGRAFTYPELESQPGQPLQTAPAPRIDSTTSLKEDGVPAPANADTRVHTIYPVVGDWFLETDITAGSVDEADALAQQLTRVDRDTWETALGQGTITSATAEEFLAEVSADIPEPPGVTVSPSDLSLPQDRYQASASYLQIVGCAWFKEYEQGNPEAGEVLAGSRDWQVLQELDELGGYADEFWRYAEAAQNGDDVSGYRMALGCA